MLSTESLDPAHSPTDLADTPLERIESEITEMAAHLAAAECRWVLLIGEFDRREGFATWGIRSTAHWLNWRCGLSMVAARERVRVARALPALPKTIDAFSKGEITYSKVRAITRVATPETDGDLVGLALSLTASQLERVVRGLDSVLDSIRKEGRAQHLERSLHYGHRDDGTGVIMVTLPPEKMAVVMQGLEAMVEEMAIADFVSEQDDASAEDTETPADPWSARLADALVRMAEVSLDPNAPDRSFSERFLVNVHYDLRSTLEDGEVDARITGGPALSSETLERLLCDAVCVPVVEVDGTPIYAGSKAPQVPRRMRRALQARDGGCRFPGCTNTRWVDAHHVIYRSKGGPTELWNLVLLCRFHHTSIHHRGFFIERSGDGLHFFRSDGALIPDVPEHGRAAGDDIVVRNTQLGLTIGPNTTVPAWDGNPLSRFGLDMVIDHLLAKLDTAA